MFAASEENLVRSLGERIGYGRMMQLAEQLWNKHCVDRGLPDGCAHASYCCTSFLVPCRCVTVRRTRHCDWCCGTRRVTQRVRDEQDRQSRSRRVRYLKERK